MAELRPAGLLLAAGGSGRLGQAKQLVSLQGETLVRRQAARLLTQANPVLAVLGAEADPVARELGDLPVGIVHNEAWAAGMGGSIAAGMKALADDQPGVLILLCDQWRIGQADLLALCSAWRGAPSRIAAACWNGQKGAPAIFPNRLFGELRGLSGEQGARGLIEHERGILQVDLPNAAFDLDTPGDLAAATRWAAGASS